MTHFTKPNTDPQPDLRAASTDSGIAADSVTGTNPFSPARHPDSIGQLGRYRILRRLGEGGMGAVYLAFDTGLEREVALKVMLPQFAAHPQARERFLREARAAAMVRSDHVVTIFDVGEEDGMPFIAMEQLRGYPLDEYLKKKGEVSIGQALRVARETALGLEAAHKLGLVHRDIKPANLWLEAPKGRLKILDFGLARRDAVDTDIALTHDGQLIGTPAFMSPEQGRGERVDHRSDLFSLGVVLYRLTTGQMPFQGRTMMAVLTSLGTHTPPDVRTFNREIPDSLAQTIEWLLRKDPAERFSSAGEVLKALDASVAVSIRRDTELVVIRVEPLFEATAPAVRQVWDGIDDMDMTLSESIVAPRPEPTGKRMRPLAWVAIALGALLPILLLAIVLIKTPKGTLVIESDDPDVEVVVKQNGATIRDKTKQREIELNVGDFTIELAEKKEGLRLTTNAFEISKNGRTSVRVRLEKPTAVAAVKPMAPQIGPPAKGPPAAVSDDPDRAAAEFLLSIGAPAEIQIDGKLLQIRTKAEMPRDKFELTGVFLDVSFVGQDADLAVFRGCKHLRTIVLNNTKNVTSAGTEHFRDSKDLSTLRLAGPFVTDAILATFKDAANLRELNLYFAPVTDDGIAAFKNCTELTSLTLIHSLVADRGLSHFKKCKLTHLWLVGSPITARGIAHFSDTATIVELGMTGGTVTDEAMAAIAKLDRIENLVLHDTKITDKSLGTILGFPKLNRLDLDRADIGDGAAKTLAEVPQLNELRLCGTKFTDGGLKGLAASKSLRLLQLYETRVTAEGVAELHRAIPKCRIELETGIIMPEK